ncbi:ABC transporter permease [Meiothermus cerbereus]|uniref:ABC transporter permease n=1 Tax=Meiothermus cerbereus TaxID=65552 RepID=UPI0004826354|nr:ABC transporter permease [Meiothermus cerbereus]
MLDLFWVEFKRSWLYLRRYPSEFVGTVVSLSILFLLLFLGARFLAGPSAEFGERTEALLAGFLLWTLTLFSYSSLSFGLSEEAQTGTLEQVFLTPYGPIPLLLVRNLAGLGTQLLLMGSIALVLLLITGARLSFTPLLLLPITTVLLGGYGLGFAMASLALLFKRVQQLLGISQFLLIFLLQYPLEGSGWLAKLGYFVPLVPGADLTRQMMAKEAALDWNLLGLALLNGLAYLALGIVVFSRAVQAAKRRGLLFGY